jgi:prepilin-type N-terminal cleavage/methylation domain-containing protein
MDFQNRQRNGFSLIEVVASVVILGLLATPILIGQYQVLSQIMPASSLLEHIFSIENAVVEQLATVATKKDLKDTKPVEKTLTEPQMKIRSECIPITAKPIADKSTLKKFKDIQVIKTQGTWIFAGKEQRETLITFAYKQTPTGEGVT